MGGGRGATTWRAGAGARRDGADRAAPSRDWADGDAVDLILTTGGTGLTARDVTPEATRAVLDTEAPGIAEALRVSGAIPGFPARRSRAASPACAARTLIVNLPGSPGGVRDGLAVLDDLRGARRGAACGAADVPLTHG